LTQQLRIVATTIKIPSVDLGKPEVLPILFEDQHLLVVNKPAAMLTTPEPENPERRALMQILHEGIAKKERWATERNLEFLGNPYRLEYEVSGILVLAKTKQVLLKLSDFFGGEQRALTFVALVAGSPTDDSFDVDVPIGPHPRVEGLVAANPKSGKKSSTHCEVEKRFRSYTLLRCVPLSLRPHQIRVHLRWVALPVVGDDPYRGKPLLLSSLKPHYRLGPGKEERPLMSLAAVHARDLNMQHPVTGEPLTVSAQWPKDFEVAIKYLKRYGGL
jgi:RluA family pseudouridine synthase